MTLIHLGSMKHLFKDEACYREFEQSIRDGLAKGDMPMFLTETDEVLFTAISPESTKEVLCNRILQRMGENPSLIDDLRDRIENDEIVD